MWPSLVALLSRVPGLLAGPVTKAITGIDIPSILKELGRLARLGYNFAKSHWRLVTIVGLLGLLLGVSCGWDSSHNQLLKERAAHQLDISNFKKAQADADVKAQTEKVILQKESKANADVADAKYTALLAEYRSNLVRYQARKGGPASTSDNQLPPAQSGDGSSADPLFPEVTITQADAQICAVNTARLVAVHDWALNPPKDGTE